jgi:hypothetical protein
MNQTMRRTFVVLAVAGLAGACGPQPTEPDQDPAMGEVGAGLVASLKLPGGTTVEFFEGLPGSTAVIERGEHPQRPALDDRLTRLEPLALYRALAPDQPPPAALVAASKRQALFEAQMKAGSSALTPAASEAAPAAPLAPAPAGGGLVQLDDDELCPGDIFENSSFGCGKNHTAVDWHACNLWQHADTTIAQNDVTEAHAGACSYRGVVRFMFRWRRFFQWSLPETHVLNPGQWEIATREHSRFFDFDILSKVLDGEPGDGYHHGAWGNR